MSEKLKLCKDCKHFVEASIIWTFYLPPRCMSPNGVTVDLVTGHKIGMSPQTNRMAGSVKCGVDGLWFETAPPKVEGPIETLVLKTREPYTLIKPQPEITHPVVKTLKAWFGWLL